MITVKQKNRSFNVTENPFWAKYHYWEPFTWPIFEKYIDKDHSYIDIGAWIGTTVLYGAQIAKHSYAIEPDTEAFVELKENIELNPELENKITTYQGCINDKQGTVKLHAHPEKKWNSSLSSLVYYANSRVSKLVPSQTLESFVDLFKIQDFNFIKIDTEGAERLIIPSSKEFLKKYKPTLHLSLHPNTFTEESHVEGILDTLEIYKNIYNRDNTKLTIESLRRLLGEVQLADIIATDR